MITFLLPETTIEVIYNPRQEKAQGCNTIAEKCPLDEQGGNLLSTGKQAKWPTGRGKGKDEPSCRAALCPEPKLSLCMDYLLSTTRTMACKFCETKKWGLEAIDSIPKCEITEISIRLITNGLLWRKQKALQGKRDRVSEHATPKHAILAQGLF